MGLAYVAEQLQPAQRVVLMDCDGEDLPVTVPLLLAALESDQGSGGGAAAAAGGALALQALLSLYKRMFR
jgi:hypothetical protein